MDKSGVKKSGTSAPWKKDDKTKQTGKRPRDEPRAPSGKPSGGSKPSFDKSKPYKPKSDGDHAAKKPRPGKKITKEDQERLRIERKQSHPQHDIIDKLVRMWNELRERQTPADRKHELVGEMMKLMKGRVMDVAMRHDTSRAVQGCLKHGTAAQKEAMCAELFGHILELSKSKHGHQHVQKMLKYGSQETRRRVAKELQGHIARLMTHALGALVVESGFTSAWSTPTCWSLFQEMYGPEYIHFKAGKEVSPRNLTGILAAHPQARKRVLESVFFTLSRAVDKNLLSLSVIQRLLCEYLQEAPPEQVVSMVAAVKEQLLSLVASREGARAAVLCLAYGTAKERKLMLRGLKGHMLDVACHLHGHMVIVAALQFVDDTKTSFSAIFSELGPHLAYLACHRHGKHVLLAMLSPKAPRYFSAYQLELLQPVSLPAYLAKRKDKAGEGEGKDGEEGKPQAKDAKGKAGEEAADGAAAAAPAAPVAPRVLPEGPTDEQKADSAPTATSKKDDVIRRAELLAQLRPGLESVCVTRTSLLARSKHGSAVLYEAAVCLGGAVAAAAGKAKAQQAPASSAPEASVPIMEAIADLVVSEPDPEEIAAQVSEMETAAASASAGASAVKSGVVMTEAGPQAQPPAGASAAAVGSSGGKAAVSEDVEMDGAEAEAEADVEDQEDEAEDDDDEDEDDSDVDMLPRDGEKGGDGEDDAEEAHEAAGGEDMLPILEFSPSHLLFKRLLAREAVPRPEQQAHAKAGKAEEPAVPAKPVFGPILYSRVKGLLAELVDSNRASFTVLELASSSDAGTAGAVKTELKDCRKQVEEGPAKDTAGVKVLLRILDGGAAAAPAAKPSPAAAPAKGQAAAPAPNRQSTGGASTGKAADKQQASTGKGSQGKARRD